MARGRVPHYSVFETPEHKRQAGLTEIQIGALRSSRLLDRDKDWPIYSTSIQKVEENLGFEVRRHIRERIKNHSAENPFAVLSMGCGDGFELFNLKQLFGNHIRTVGTTLTNRKAGKKTAGFDWLFRTKKETNQGGIDRLVTGSLRKKELGEQFDFIFSSAGESMHTNLKTTSVEFALHHLKPGGMAVLECYDPNDRVLFEIQHVFSKKGVTDFGIEKKRNGDIVWFRKPFNH